MTKNSFSYRIGSIDDLDQLQELAIIAYGQFQTAFTEGNWEIFKNNLHNKQKLIDLFKVARCFVCLHNNKIIGMAYIIPSGNPTDIFLSEWCYIRMVAVNPGYWGQGIAKKLTQMCIDYAKQNNETTIALHTSEFMHAARHIYENIGFKVFKEIPALFGKRYWLYTLELK